LHASDSDHKALLLLAFDLCASTIILDMLA